MNPQNTLNQAVSLHQQGQLTEALTLYEKILTEQPRNPDALHLSGVALHQMGQHNRAIAQISDAIRSLPAQPAFHNNLGLCHQALLQWTDAQKQFEQAISLNAEYPEALNNLGVVLRELGQYKQARRVLDKAVKLKPGYAEAINNLGLIERQQGRNDEAVECFKRACALQPNLFQAQLNLGTLLFEKGDIFAAEPAFANAFRINPNDVEIILMLGNFSLEMGYLEQAIDWYRKGLRIDPDHAFLNSNHLFALNYLPDISQQALFQHYRDWATKSFQTISADPEGYEWQDFDKEKRLTVAYLSADLRNHASSYFILPLLKHHDRTKFHTVALSMSRQKDHISESMNALFDGWIDIFDKDDDEVEVLIKSLGIDILVDLAGHTRGQRLSLLARKPTPALVSYLGYGYTTGLKQIDCFLADKYFVPVQDQQFFSEKIEYLEVPPFCYEPPESAPGTPPPPPVLKNGFITYGCISRPVRINHRVIRTWAALLKQVPQSRLRLDHPAFQRQQTQQHFRQLFEQQGIEPCQLLFASSKPHWRSFEWIDILLDTFPHNSGTTTFEALWMGLPVVTLRERAPLGRFGDSLLHCIDFPQWINDSEEQYINCAATLSESADQLKNLRGTIHNRFRESPLMDGNTFTRHFEKALRKIWHECCNSYGE